MDPINSTRRVALILVNHNSPADTIRCLESVRTLEGNAQLHVVVVDNGSRDDSIELIGRALATIPHSKLISLPENRGYAAGCNAGIVSLQPSVDSPQSISPQLARIAQQGGSSVGSLQSAVSSQHALKSDVVSNSGAEFIWLLNNDTVLEPSALISLLEAADNHQDIRIWGSTIRDMDPPHALQCSGGFRYLSALSIPMPVKEEPTKKDEVLFVQSRRLDYISGVSMFVRADVFDEGMLDEKYFLYYEELELVRLAGGKGKLAWCPASVVYHTGGATTGGADPNRGRGSYAAHYYGNRSALRYTWKYHKMYFPLVFLFRLVAKSVLFIRYGEWGGFGPMLRAYWDFMRGVWASAR